jgi:hypothetical protein
LFGQRMTHARGCASDTLPWGSNPTSPPQDGRMAVVGCRSRAKQRWCIAVCRQRASEVVDHSHADSKVGRVPREEVVVASKLRVAQLVVPVRCFRSTTTIGISPRIERAPCGLSRVDRRAEGEPRGSGASESGRWRGAGPGCGHVTVFVRVRAGTRVGRLEPWGRDQVVKRARGRLGSVRVGAVRRA